MISDRHQLDSIVKEDGFFEYLKFSTPELEKIEIEDNESLDLSNLVFSGIVVSKDRDALAYYAESKDLKNASTYTKNLLKSILKTGAEEVVFLINFNKDNPFFLVDSCGDIFVHINKWEKKKGIFYELIPFKDYLK